MCVRVFVFLWLSVMAESVMLCIYAVMFFLFVFIIQTTRMRDWLFFFACFFLRH